MPKWAQILVSLACLVVIALGAEYAVARERLRNADLHGWYQEINGQYFGGELGDAEVAWGDLTEDEAVGMTHQYEDGSTRIVLDRGWTTSKSRAREVLEHEACHVPTASALREQGADPHGPLFQECMTRFGAKP